MASKTTQSSSTRLKYSWSLKRQVILEHRTGLYTQAELGARYGVTEKVVNHWISRYGSEVGQREISNFSPMTNEEQKAYDVLKQQVEALKKDLEFAQMKARAMEIMMELAKEEYGIDIRKNSGAKQPVKSKKNIPGQK
jgi:transposase-like protein